MNRIKKQKARLLRKQGKSLGEIVSVLDVARSTASLWTSDVVVDEKGLRRIEKRRILSREKGHKILHEMKLQRLQKAEGEAKALLEKAVKDKSKEMIALAMMYWCEGNKNDNRVGFTNSDPNLARAFVSMLESVFHIDKSRLKICLHLHDYHDESKMLRFWSDATMIPLGQFNKTFKKESFHKYSVKGYKGCAQIVYYDVHVARVLLSFAKNFIKLYI